MYLALITLPLLGSLASGFFGRKIGASGAMMITCSCVILTTMLAITAFIEVGLNNIPVTIQLFKWIDSESLNGILGILLWFFDSVHVNTSFGNFFFSAYIFNRIYESRPT